MSTSQRDCIYVYKDCVEVMFFSERQPSRSLCTHTIDEHMLMTDYCTYMHSLTNAYFFL